MSLIMGLSMLIAHTRGPYDFWGTPLTAAHSHKSYRPFAVLSFLLQFKTLGVDVFRPQPLRAFNVAMHATNSLLLLALLRHRAINCINQTILYEKPQNKNESTRFCIRKTKRLNPHNFVYEQLKTLNPTKYKIFKLKNVQNIFFCYKL